MLQTGQCHGLCWLATAMLARLLLLVMLVAGCCPMPLLLLGRCEGHTPRSSGCWGVHRSSYGLWGMHIQPLLYVMILALLRHHSR